MFNESNGYLSVWHMIEPVKDEVGTLVSQDVGTTATAGMIGPARHLAGKQGVFGGDKITSYPTGAVAHTSEAWFRPGKPNVTVVAWGNEQGQGKVVMQFRSPPHIGMDCYFSEASMAGRRALPMSEWVHVAFVYQRGDARIYVNGVLDNASTGQGTPLNIRSPARLWLGGWYHNYDFVGDLDEVRVSKVTRSVDWIRLEYENQKPMATLVGPVVQPGSSFAVSPEKLNVAERGSATVTAQAGGAQKVYWILQRDGRASVVGVDRLTCRFEAGRVAGDEIATLRFKAVHADGVKTKDIPITIEETIPDPMFTLKAPANWDGRETIEVMPMISNFAAMQAKGAGELKYTWSVSGLATIREVAPDKLILKRAQNSGRLVVQLALGNGGAAITQSTTIAVREPKQDAWVHRAPAGDEKPEDNQFLPRNDQNEGTLHCNGTLAEPADSVFLRVYADDKLVTTETRKPNADRTYALASQFYLDGEQATITSGSVTGNVLTLKLASPSTAHSITYLDSKSWNPSNLLYGLNGIAALTFCEVPIDDARFAK